MTAQDRFRAALMDPDLPVPPGLVDPAGRPAGRRFDVYRNNVTASLIRALEAGFPVTRRIVGAEFFAAMATVFLRSHPPRSRLIMLYGSQMPGFLAGFPPVAHLGYLPDVARLELAIRQSYHAADMAPLAAERLAELTPEALLSARVRLVPALRLVRAVWPIVSIWQANSGTATPGPIPPGAEDALVARPGFDPQITCLPPGGGAALQALIEGQTFGEAFDSHPTDIGALLRHLLDAQAIADLIWSA